jgi:hypothetical protein
VFASERRESRDLRAANRCPVDPPPLRFRRANHARAPSSVRPERLTKKMPVREGRPGRAKVKSAPKQNYNRLTASSRRFGAFLRLTGMAFKYRGLLRGRVTPATTLQTTTASASRCPAGAVTFL